MTVLWKMGGRKADGTPGGATPVVLAPTVKLVRNPYNGNRLEVIADPETTVTKGNHNAMCKAAYEWADQSRAWQQTAERWKRATYQVSMVGICGIVVLLIALLWRLR